MLLSLLLKFGPELWLSCLWKTAAPMKITSPSISNSARSGGAVGALLIQVGAALIVRRLLQPPLWGQPR